MITNMLNITDDNVLADTEERIAKKRAIELFDGGLLARLEVGTFKALKTIHTQLYGDVYPSAGQKRTVDICKGRARFTPVAALDTGLGFADIMPAETFDDIMNKYIEMNIAHPFRTGNTPALCIWVNAMLGKKVGLVVDWSRVDKHAFLNAMEVCGVDDGALYNVIKPALTRDLGRAMYVRGLDAMFAFVGYKTYRASEL